MAVSAPPSGARNTAPSPPAAPASIRMRRSRGESPSRMDSHEPMPAPMCDTGPSRPALPPAAMVQMEVSPFSSGARRRMTPFSA